VLLGQAAARKRIEQTVTEGQRQFVVITLSRPIYTTVCVTPSHMKIPYLKYNDCRTSGIVACRRVLLSLTIY
jgi:hypothetical protein